tara:strand:- start:1110 stop:1760 length:651 start_codon:yes stop_codon:yes gene_type:complete
LGTGYEKRVKKEGLLIMNKNLLIETISFNPKPLSLSEGKSVSGLPLVEGILATAEVKNGNGRYYSKKIWDREIDKYMESVKTNRAVGELDHPESSVINLKNVCHNIKDIWWNGDHIMGKIEILPTPSGNILQALINSGITVGVSSRGMGSVKQMGETLEVQEDFELLCWDFVSTPSNPGSWMAPLNESLNNTIKNNNKANDIIREILCAHGNCPIF